MFLEKEFLMKGMSGRTVQVDKIGEFVSSDQSCVALEVVSELLAMLIWKALTWAKLSKKTKSLCAKPYLAPWSPYFF